MSAFAINGLCSLRCFETHSDIIIVVLLLPSSSIIPSSTVLHSSCWVWRWGLEWVGSSLAVGLAVDLVVGLVLVTTRGLAFLC